MKPEEKARQEIDRLLNPGGWIIQDYSELNLGASLGFAVREFPLQSDKHFTLKTNPLRYDDLQDFIQCYNPKNRFERKETDRFKSFSYNELMRRDKGDEAFEACPALPAWYHMGIQCVDRCAGPDRRGGQWLAA